VKVKIKEHNWKTLHYWSQNWTHPVHRIPWDDRWLLSLSRYNTEFYGTYGSLQSSWECHSTSCRNRNTQIPSCSNSLNSTSIISSYINTVLLNGLSPSPFSNQKSLQDNSTPIHDTFPTLFTTVHWYPIISREA